MDKVKIGSIFTAKVANKEKPDLNKKEVIGLPTDPINYDDVFILFKTPSFNIYCQKKEKFLEENNQIF